MPLEKGSGGSGEHVKSSQLFKVGSACSLKKETVGAESMSSTHIFQKGKDDPLERKRSEPRTSQTREAFQRGFLGRSPQGAGCLGCAAPQDVGGSRAAASQGSNEEFGGLMPVENVLCFPKGCTCNLATLS